MNWGEPVIDAQDAQAEFGTSPRERDRDEPMCPRRAYVVPA